MNKEIKNAVDTCQRAQRNYNLEKLIPNDDLNTLIYAATNSPSKQNEVHYSLHVFTDQEKIKEIYNTTKRFLLMRGDADINKTFGVDETGEFWQDVDISVTNSQILSNVLFVYVREEGSARGGTHISAQIHRESDAMTIYNQQIGFSIGISVGELILSAALLGYKTGICSAFDPEAVRNILKVSNKPLLMVGVGYENENVDRRLHAELLNKDVPNIFRTGNLEDPWKFPSFEKQIEVKINGN
jgi:nitroreductase